MLSVGLDTHSPLASLVRLVQVWNALASLVPNISGVTSNKVDTLSVVHLGSGFLISVRCFQASATQLGDLH